MLTLDVLSLDKADLTGLARRLGAPWPDRPAGPAWQGPLAAFRHDAPFDPGAGGAVEFLQVAYSDPGPTLTRLERHLMTEQALVVTGAVGLVQVLARDRQGRPDPSRMIALYLAPGEGLVMGFGVWHGTLAPHGAARGIMLTRASTTADLADYLHGAGPLQESELAALDPLVRIAAPTGPAAP